MAAATSFVALQKLRASDLQALLDDHLRVAKTANTDRASTTTPAADPHLSLTLKANTTYIVRFVLFMTGATAGDLACRLTFPAGASTPWGGLRLLNSSTATNGSLDAAGVGTAISGTSDIGVATVTSNGSMCTLEACVAMGSTAGAVGLSWCQGSSNATNTTLYAGSFMTATRIR